MSAAHEFGLGQKLNCPWAEGLAICAGEHWDYVEGFVGFEARVTDGPDLGDVAGCEGCCLVRVGKAGFQACLPLSRLPAVLATFFAALVLAALFVNAALFILAAVVLAAVFVFAALILAALIVLAALILAALFVAAFEQLKHGGDRSDW
jgi:hypothetical protein